MSRAGVRGQRGGTILQGARRHYRRIRMPCGFGGVLKAMYGSVRRLPRTTCGFEQPTSAGIATIAGAAALATIRAAAEANAAGEG